MLKSSSQMYAETFPANFESLSIDNALSAGQTSLADSSLSKPAGSAAKAVMLNKLSTSAAIYFLNSRVFPHVLLFFVFPYCIYFLALESLATAFEIKI